MQALFAWESGNSRPTTKDSPEIIAKSKNLDNLIGRHAPKWPLEKINKVDLAILRIAFYELVYQPQTPPKVIIDESIELAKEFGSESSPSFINGVLGSALKDNQITSHDQSTPNPEP